MLHELSSGLSIVTRFGVPVIDRLLSRLVVLDRVLAPRFDRLAAEVRRFAHAREDALSTAVYLEECAAWHDEAASAHAHAIVLAGESRLHARVLAARLEPGADLIAHLDALDEYPEHLARRLARAEVWMMLAASRPKTPRGDLAAAPWIKLAS